MEEFKRLVLEANKYFKTADHLVYVTYPLVQDHKLLITALENLYLAMKCSMDAIIYYDKMFKRIGPVPEAFETKYEVFEMKCAPRYKIPSNFVDVLKELKRFVNDHKGSQVEFVRHNKVVICSEGYETIRTVDLSLVKNYVIYVRGFMKVVNGIK